MVYNVIVVYGGFLVGILGVLVVVYFTGRTIGQKSNGYVKQDRCESNMSEFRKDQGGLHTKMNDVVSAVSRIEGYLSKHYESR